MKLPIGDHAGRFVCCLTCYQEKLFECGNVLRLYVLGGFCRDRPLNEASGPKDFQRSLVTQTVRRRDDDPRAGTHVDVALHLQGNQRFPQGRTGNAESLGQFSFGGKTTAGRKLSGCNQRPDLIGDLQVKAARLDGLYWHNEYHRLGSSRKQGLTT